MPDKNVLRDRYECECRLGVLYTLPQRQVLDNLGRSVLGYMHELPLELRFAFGQQRRERLHLQQRLQRVRWRILYELRRRLIQELCW